MTQIQPPPRAGRNARIAAAAFAVLAALAVATGVLAWTGGWFTDDSDAAPIPRELFGQEPSPDFTAEAADRLEQSLTAGDPAGMPAIAVPAGGELDEEFLATLAQADVRVDAASFEDLGDGIATVQATTAGGVEPGRWTLYLVAAEGRWQLAGTTSVDDQ